MCLAASCQPAEDHHQFSHEEYQSRNQEEHPEGGAVEEEEDPEEDMEDVGEVEYLED